MNKLKEFFSLAIPYFWGFCWAVGITAGSLGLAVVLVKWMLKVLGVMQ